jgi:hypothetical protein
MKRVLADMFQEAKKQASESPEKARAWDDVVRDLYSDQPSALAEWEALIKTCAIADEEIEDSRRRYIGEACAMARHILFCGYHQWMLNLTSRDHRGRARESILTGFPALKCWAIFNPPLCGLNEGPPCALWTAQKSLGISTKSEDNSRN